MQRIEFIGNLTGMPEIKTTKNDNHVCVFTVAVNDADSVDYYRVSVWNKLGENCNKYLSKGKKVYVSGKLKARIYDVNGKSYLTLDVTAMDVEFLTPKSQTQNATVQNGTVTPDEQLTDIDADELPF